MQHWYICTPLFPLDGTALGSVLVVLQLVVISDKEVRITHRIPPVEIQILIEDFG